MKTNHFICKVQDSINNYNEIVSVYCDVRTANQAKNFFIKHEKIKKYIGNKRYQIIFRQNSVLIQYPE